MEIVLRPVPVRPSLGYSSSLGGFGLVQADPSLPMQGAVPIMFCHALWLNARIPELVREPFISLSVLHDWRHAPQPTSTLAKLRIRLSPQEPEGAEETMSAAPMSRQLTTSEIQSLFRSDKDPAPSSLSGTRR